MDVGEADEGQLSPGVQRGGVRVKRVVRTSIGSMPTDQPPAASPARNCWRGSGESRAVRTCLPVFPVAAPRLCPTRLR